VIELTSCVKFDFNNIGPFIIRPVIFSVVSIRVNRMQGEGRGVKKIGGRKVIHSQSREMVINI
jgi:hypothetical protein